MTSTKPKRRTRATRYFWESYDRMLASRVCVDVDSPYSTVCISAPGEDDIYLDNGKADEFINECRILWKRYPSLPRDVCEMAIAEPYTELWS